MSAQSLPFAEGAVVGEYRLGEVIGRGGMGCVYRAQAPSGEQVALKALWGNTVRDLGDSDEALQRFAREAKIHVAHPNVLRALDAGIHDGVPWIAFELLSGQTLDERAAEGPLGAERIVDIALQAASGLAAAHAAGIVHRDVKPSNLFLENDGNVKLIDFGIAHFAAAETQLTRTGSVLGTPAYLSPEQAAGTRELDGRSDIWSLGVLLYETLSGKNPFVRNTPLATMLAIMVEEAPPLGMLVEGLPSELLAIIRKCLRKDVKERFASADELAEALTDVPLDSVSAAALTRTITSDAQAPTPISIAPGEQRLVAVLLAVGVTDVAALRSAIVEGGAKFISVAGDRAIGVFGGEALEGDEVPRALRAAVSAQGAARRITIAAGRASYSGTTGIAGAVLDTAERGLAVEVNGGTGIVLAPTAADLVKDDYDLERIAGGFAILRAEGPVRTTIETNAPLVTVGREAELAQLRSAIQGCLAGGQLSLAWITGPPGIGKSHLLRACRELADENGFRVMWANGEPGEGRQAFSLLGELLRGHLVANSPRGESSWTDLTRALAASFPAGEVEVTAAIFAELLSIVPDEQASMITAVQAARRDPQLMQDRLRLAMTDWLIAIAAEKPLALLLEDLQWADEASLDLIGDMADEGHQVPLLVVATARAELYEKRAELFSAANVSHLRPKGLLPNQLREFAASLGTEVSAGFLTRLSERTSGNPMFAEQIIRTLSEEGRSAADLETAELPLPVSVEMAVQSRLDHLPSPAKDLVKRAAVWGRPFTVRDLEAMGVVAADSHLRDLARRDLVAGRGSARKGSGREYRFRTSLVRDVAYRMVAEGLRQGLHLLAAEHSSEADVPPEEVALHYEKAGRRRDAGAWFVKAIRSASRRGDTATVLRCSEAALTAPLSDEAQWIVLMARSDAFELIGNLDEQATAIEAALAAAEEPAHLAQTLTSQAVWALRRGDRTLAESVITEAVGLAEGAGSVDVLVRAYGRRAAILTYLGKIEAAAEALEKARENAQEMHRPMVATWAAQIATAKGDLGARREAYAEAAKGYEAAGDLRRAAGAEVNLADTNNRVGAYAEAENALMDSIEKCRRIGARFTEGYAQMNLAYALLMQQRTDDALLALEQASKVADETGDVRLALWGDVYRAQAKAKKEPRAASEIAERVVARSKKLGDPPLELFARVLLARAALAENDGVRAYSESSKALGLLESLDGIEEGEADVYATHAAALRLLGRHDEAEKTRLRGSERVQEVARYITDEQLRAGFLENVAVHRELLKTDTP